MKRLLPLIVIYRVFNVIEGSSSPQAAQRRLKVLLVRSLWVRPVYVVKARRFPPSHRHVKSYLGSRYILATTLLSRVLHAYVDGWMDYDGESI